MGDENQSTTGMGQAPYRTDDHSSMFGFLGISDVEDDTKLLGDREGRHLFSRRGNELTSPLRIGWDENDGGRRQLNPPWSA